MRTIAVMNQKGGCGKTTIAIHTSGALSRMGRRVLLIDLDPQAHASLGLGVQGERESLTTYELLLDPVVTVTDAMKELRPGFCIVPGSTVLSGVEQELADTAGREERLAEKISKLPPDSFDFVIVDCPPSVGLLTFNALVAVNEVIIPVDASYFSLHGLSKLRETIQVIEDELKHPLRVHVVCNNIDTRTHFSNEMIEQVEKFHAGVLAEAYISNSVRLKEAAVKGVTIFDLDPASKAARQFLSLSREVVERVPRERAVSGSARVEPWQGPRRVSGGVLFALEAPGAARVTVTGEFTNWSREGKSLYRDPIDGLWKALLDIEPGEYEYRFIVDGVWIRDPHNKDYIRNEFGQENSLLVV